MPRFNKATMVKRGASCVSETWRVWSKRNRINIKKKRNREGWQPNVNGPYSGFK
jgi:hypothetical protein